MLPGPAEDTECYNGRTWILHWLECGIINLLGRENAVEQ